MNTSTNTNNRFTDNYYTDITENHIDEAKLNHQGNCFTIINKHFINSDTSSEAEFADVEIITSNDIIMEPNNWDVRRPYDEEIITYDPELDKETRTIWIYSFKNKHLLNEDEYGFANIPPARETSSRSTSTSIESDEEQTMDKSTNVRRLGSPIPPSYIPRLNLSLGPTLSTVTEVSEPNKPLTPVGSNLSPENKFLKPKNSWFLNDIDKLDSGRSIRKHEKSTNIINWMGLSPREKRRRSKEQGDKWEGSLLKLEPLHNKEIIEDNELPSYVSGKDNALRLQVDVEVHVSVNEKSPEKKSSGTPNTTDDNVKSNSDDISPINKIKHADDIKECAKDRGDHDMKFENTQQVLFHKIPDHLNDLNRIYDEPIKNLSNATWEREAKFEKETGSYDYITNKMASILEEDNSGDTLWMKNNMPLLKPSQWNEYLPITESPFSLHLSLGSIIEEREPWFKRFIKYINCCK